MTPENKELLLKDLCARLPYNNTPVTVIDDWFYEKLPEYTKLLDLKIIQAIKEDKCTVKPHLRPLSSITPEEERHFFALTMAVKVTSASTMVEHLENFNAIKYSQELIDWLITNHFDYLGLIERGLAIETPIIEVKETNSLEEEIELDF